MSEITLYTNGEKLVERTGEFYQYGKRPTIRWREKAAFQIKLSSGTFAQGTYKYAFDYDRDFLHTAPCNAGECTLSDNTLSFEVIFNSERQAEATNGKRLPIPFYIQITRNGDDYADYILDDAIWVSGCVWDCNLPAGEPISNYYTKEEINELLTELNPGGGVKQIQSDWEQSDNKAVDFIKNKPDLTTYLTTAQKGVANGVASLNSSGKVLDSELDRSVPVTVIPAATSAYNLADGVFEHEPSAAPTYTLPTVTNATRTHWIVLDVSFSSVQTIAFEDAQGVIIAPLDTLTIAANDVVEYLCQYDALQSKWVVACGKLNS